MSYYRPPDDVPGAEATEEAAAGPQTAWPAAPDPLGGPPSQPIPIDAVMAAADAQEARRKRMRLIIGISVAVDVVILIVVLAIFVF